MKNPVPDEENEVEPSMLNLDYLRKRLDDPALLGKAVDVREAAVPVGGKRRGGFVCVWDEADAGRIMAILAAHAGFPNLVYEPSDDPEAMSCVRWGDDPPSCPAIEAPDIDWACLDVLSGRYYGYSEAAIRAFLLRKWSKTLAKAALRRHPAPR